MAQKSVLIFNDTVIKLSINQGLEEQRVQETLGTFTSGELAYTRDTGRVFVGDNSDGEGDHVGMQETIGGSLVGNKYLGLLDSKPLTVFSDNATPLSYESVTERTETQDYPDFVEQPLLLDTSKFRDKSTDEATEPWSRWSRKATYNPKYNAYNGDYMFDIYNNALILFDNRISGDPESDTQPVIKTDENGEPVEPETFIVDGEEIPSTDPRAINIKRRTKLQNYLVEGETSEGSAIYGDGYVVMRILEPDNKTIRFKHKGFTISGNPEDGANISHNILEVGEMPVDRIAACFSDDFVVSDMVYLNKEIKDVKSITSPTANGLKIPTTIIFSKKYTDEHDSVQRGAVGVMGWNVVDTGSYVNIDTETSYKVILEPAGEVTDDKDPETSYPKFNLKIKEDVIPVQEYYIQLDGLKSNQEDPDYLRIDIDATTKNPLTNPVLKLETDSAGLSNHADFTNPYYIENYEGNIAYTGNLGITENGLVGRIDTYSDEYKALAKAQIEQWEEENVSTNSIIKPVTILASSDDKNLYPVTTEETTEDLREHLLNLESYTRLDATLCKFNTLNLIEGLTEKGQYIMGVNTSENPSTDDLVFSDTYETEVKKLAASGGMAWAVALDTPLKPHTKSYTLKATLSEFGNVESKAVTAKIILALFNKDGMVTYTHTILPYSTEQMEVTLNIHEDLTDDCFLVAGFMGDTDDKMSPTYKLTIDELTCSYLNYTEDDDFARSKCGVNVTLDFTVEPYLFCSRKIVQSPSSVVLPAITNVSQYPNNPSTTYFNGFSDMNIKTWNNLVTVMGHNHYNNTLNAESETFILDGYNGDASKTTTVKGKAFFSVGGIEYSDNGTIDDNSGLNEEELALKAVFTWQKVVVEGNTAYILPSEYDTRSEDEKDAQGNDITYLRINGTNILTSTSQIFDGDTITDEESGISSTTRYLMPEASVLRQPGAYKIEFGNDNWSGSYDLISHGIVSYDSFIGFSYDEAADKWSFGGQELKEIKFIGSSTYTLSDTALDSFLSDLDGNIYPSTIITGSNRADSYTLMKITSLYESEGTDDEGNPETTTEDDVEWKMFNEVDYILGLTSPGTLSNAKIKESGYTAVTIDESVEDADKVILPYHAKTVLLEVTHVTTSHNTIGIFYANEFEDLGVTLSGLPVAEFDTEGDSLEDGLASNGDFSPLTASGYAQSGGVYKQLVPKVRVDHGFHDLSQSVEANKDKLPSLFWSNANEKALLISNKTERQVIEVPVQRSKYSGHRHFSLRLANVRPTTLLENNYVALRVVGYTV